MQQEETPTILRKTTINLPINQPGKQAAYRTYRETRARWRVRSARIAAVAGSRMARFTILWLKVTRMVDRRRTDKASTLPPLPPRSPALLLPPPSLPPSPPSWRRVLPVVVMVELVLVVEQHFCWWWLKWWYRLLAVVGAFVINWSIFILFIYLLWVERFVSWVGGFIFLVIFLDFYCVEFFD